MEMINAENLILQELTTLLRKLTGIYISSQKTAENVSQSPNANSVHAVSGLPCPLTHLRWANKKKKTTRQPVSGKGPPTFFFFFNFFYFYFIYFF